MRVDLRACLQAAGALSLPWPNALSMRFGEQSPGSRMLGFPAQFGLGCIGFVRVALRLTRFVIAYMDFRVHGRLGTFVSLSRASGQRLGSKFGFKLERIAEEAAWNNLIESFSSLCVSLHETLHLLSPGCFKSVWKEARVAACTALGQGCQTKTGAGFRISGSSDFRSPGHKLSE